MTNLSRIRVVVLGSGRVGKSAVTVRYLTKRYIGEYSSNSDLMYRHQVTFDNVTTEVEILDTSKCVEEPQKAGFVDSDKTTGCLYEHIRWGEAFVVVYSVCDRESFSGAHQVLQSLTQLKLPSYFSVLLLGNKRDLDHSRQIAVDAGHELSLQYGCQFYEVSAAESGAGVALAFQSLLREARSVQLLRALPIRRKLGVNSVSKVLGTIFGKNGGSGNSISSGSSSSNSSSGNSRKADRKKRPSLSI